MKTGSLIACHECDLLQHIPHQRQGGKARCRRCDAVLHRSVSDSLNRTLALTLAGLVLFFVANSFPFLSFKMQGQATETTLATGVRDLYAQGMWELALLVLLTSMLVPLLQLLLLLYILLPLKFGRKPWRLATVFRLLQRLGPWGMMEVFMLGILVAVVKLVEMAQIIPGLALWSFALLIFVLAGAAAALDPRVIWERVEVGR
jgi:paraquat-inducible protein A